MAYLYESPDTALGEPAPDAKAANPVFRFDCAGGCSVLRTTNVGGFPVPLATPQTTAQCQALLYRAASLAIALANKAAALLEADPVDKATAAIFLRIFGHPPSRPVPWDKNRPSSAGIAFGFRSVARNLHERVITFRCRPAPAGHPLTRAFTTTDNLTTINLCPPFWLSDEHHQAGTIIHETLHLIFPEFFSHAGALVPGDKDERRRDNAHCFKAFVLLANGYAPEDFVVEGCRNRPA